MWRHGGINTNTSATKFTRQWCCVGRILDFNLFLIYFSNGIIVFSFRFRMIMRWCRRRDTAFSGSGIAIMVGFYDSCYQMVGRSSYWNVTIVILKWRRLAVFFSMTRIIISIFRGKKKYFCMYNDFKTTLVHVLLW